MILSEELSRADEFDRQGRHVEALDCLVAAVRANQVAGLTRLGKRLLIGDRAPLRPKDALGMLMEAAEKGCADAPALLCVLFALGLHLRHDLEAALECLVVSAVRGNEQSQGQLQALCADPALVSASRAHPAAVRWSDLASRIDLGFWQRAAGKSVLSESPYICRLGDFIPPAVCAWLRGRALGRLRPAQVYDAVEQRVTVHEDRSNSSAIFNLLETDLVNVLLQTRMAACTGLPLQNFEAATVLHYSVGQQIREHYDFIDPNVPDYEEQIRRGGQRCITFLVYLNDEYEGGETGFPRVGLSHRGRGGEGLFFVNAFDDGRPDTRTLHAGRPVRSGEKWIVSQFIRNHGFLQAGTT